MRFEVFKEEIYIWYVFNLFDVLGVGSGITIVFINLCENVSFFLSFFWPINQIFLKKSLKKLIKKYGLSNNKSEISDIIKIW